MTGYIVLGVFVAVVIITFSAYMTGRGHGRKSAESDFAQAQERAQKSEADYQKTKQEIKYEVFKDAEKEKASIAAHGNAVDRFNAVNDVLRCSSTGAD